MHSWQKRTLSIAPWADLDSPWGGGFRMLGGQNRHFVVVPLLIVVVSLLVAQAAWAEDKPNIHTWATAWS
jgi:hypothetical protein